MLMPHLLRYSRNRTTSVERLDEDTLRASCRLEDTLMEAHVEITVRLPDLDISAIRGHVSRDDRGGCLSSLEPLEKAIGVRIGPGMTKILQGLVGENFPCPQILFMVEECCHGIILYFTKDELQGVLEVAVSPPPSCRIDTVKSTSRNPLVVPSVLDGLPFGSLSVPSV